MRISDRGVLALALLSLAACGDSGGPVPGADAEKIACAIAGSETLSQQCWIEREQAAEGPLLTLHQPDGGFHRLRVVEGGLGLVAADGAETAAIERGDGAIEVSVGDARYRLPANPDGTIR